MALDALLFDVDGTLIDTNFEHVEAWARAFAWFGYRVAHDRIAVEVGKGGDKLVPSILGAEIAEREGEKLGHAHTEEFRKIAESKHLKVYPGVRELFTELKRRGLKAVLATSSKNEELEMTQKSAQIDLTQLVDEVVTGDEAKESKPSPGIVLAATDKLKMSPAQCAMVGDTPFDIDACRDAGVVAIGVTCGGINSAETLKAAGARIVYRDPQDILRHLDDALRISSPGPAHLTWDAIENLVRRALAVAEAGLEHGEAPIGCVIARGDGQIIAEGHNRMNATQNKTAHAEMVAFAAAAGKVPTDARDLILACTLEPCVMCLGASMEAAIDTILYALPAPADGGTGRVRPPRSPESQMPRILGGVLAAQSRELFRKFLNRSPNPQQAAFARQLLELTK
jgi:HAD superfamily hydrolase (TIGR01509 family)